MSANSPLVEIRAAELAAARSVAAAREEVARSLTGERSEATNLVERARAEGRALADQHYEAAIDTARSEAADVARSVEQRIGRLRTDVAPELDRLTQAMLELVMARME